MPQVLLQFLVGIYPLTLHLSEIQPVSGMVNVEPNPSNGGENKCAQDESFTACAEEGRET